jgi:hypothetical protein
MEKRHLANRKQSCCENMPCYLVKSTSRENWKKFPMQNGCNTLGRDKERQETDRLDQIRYRSDGNEKGKLSIMLQENEKRRTKQTR